MEEPVSQSESIEEGAYEVEIKSISESDGEFNYDELPVESDQEEEGEEDPFATLAMTQETQDEPSLESKFVYRPESTDDFVRNFLVRLGMNKTLETFQAEWYELQAKGKLKSEDIAPVPDVYLRNQELREQVASMRAELEKAQFTAEKAKATWDKLRKERDFHRMHHHRVQQEKGKYVGDIDKLKKVHETHESRYNELATKYAAAMKEKMLMKLERDRLAGKAEAFQKSVGEDDYQEKPTGRGTKQSFTSIKQKENLLPFGKKPAKTAPGPKKAPIPTGRAATSVRDSKWPAEERDNPFLSINIPEPSNVNRWVLSKTYSGHQLAVSGVAHHPKKAIVATVSDDNTWKIWSIPNGDLIMSGEGHRDWISGVAFHPRGTHLATASGDKTVKIWDFVNACCTATFTEHTQAVWSCAFHDSGDFLATSSMDHSIRLWDVNSARCRNAYRGHVDSVNKVCFQPYSNVLCSGSGDKTVSMWDMRTAQCIQTFYGHANSVTHVAFTMKGDTIASSDSDGVVKLWDVRMVQERLEIVTSDQPANATAFDRSGTILAIGSEDGNIYVHKADTGDEITTLKGHDDSVQDLLFDVNGKYLISGGADNSFRYWS